MVVAVSFATACYDDKGSYDYVEVNEITVEGLEERYPVVYKKTVLEIPITLHCTLDKDTPERYEYEWKAVSYADNTGKGVVIGTERDLSYLVELAPGAYALYLKVRDKETGLLWMGESRIDVGTETGKGFLLIGEDREGYVNVDMIAMPKDTVVLRNLLTNNGLPRLRGARNIHHTGAASNSFVKLWVMTDDRSYYVNTTTFEGYESNTFERLVYSNMDIPAELNPVWIYSKNCYPSGDAASRRVIICSDGNVFYAGLSSSEADEAYSNPLNRVGTAPNELFKAYPCAFLMMDMMFGGALYDMDNNRFVSFGSNATTCSVLSDKSGDVFPWKQPEGRTIKFGENIKEKGSMALMVDEPTKDFHIYQFSASFSVSKIGYYAINKSLAPDLDKAEFFAFAPKRTMLFYTVGKTLHCYDYNPGNERHYQLELEDEITMMKFDNLSEWAHNGLYIATYNDQEGGVLQKYVLGDNPNALDLIKDEKCRWTNLVKVKNMDWRNSAN